MFPASLFPSTQLRHQRRSVEVQVESRPALPRQAEQRRHTGDAFAWNQGNGRIRH
jgi:hypothetical protein